MKALTYSYLVDSCRLRDAWAFERNIANGTRGYPSFVPPPVANLPNTTRRAPTAATKGSNNAMKSIKRFTTSCITYKPFFGTLLFLSLLSSSWFSTGRGKDPFEFYCSSYCYVAAMEAVYSVNS